MSNPPPYAPPYSPSVEKMDGAPPGSPPQYQPSSLPQLQPGHSPPVQPSSPPLPRSMYPPLQPSYPSLSAPINQQPVMTGNVIHACRDIPAHIVCPFCRTYILTEIRYTNGNFTWLMAAIFCLVGGIFCLFVFCFDCCKDVVHICPNCQQQITQWSRL